MNESITNQFTKEAIKNRLMLNAANLWGVKNPMSLDPFVRMLMEAFSLEVYRAANEAQNIEGRILDKIAALLTPNLLTMPSAAHAIMQATPAEATHLLHPHTCFQIKKGYASKNGGMPDMNVDVDFTPVDHVHLVKGRIAYMATGYQLFGYDEESNKASLLRTPSPLPWGSVFIGIESGDEVRNFENMALYFDFSYFSEQPWVCQLLPLCKVYYQGEEISLRAGRQYGQDNKQEIDNDLFKSYDVMLQVSNDIKNIYEDNFVTLDEYSIVGKKNAFPSEIADRFNAEQLNAKVPPANVHWLQIQFPAKYSYEILENLFIAINAFPVLNRRLISRDYNYATLNNILPLSTEIHERFMTVHRVTDGTDRIFSEIPVSQSEGLLAGYYTIRQGGAERFDKRSAQDMVNYLLELTRDEVAAFSSMDQDFLKVILEELSMQLKLIHAKTANTGRNVQQLATYLIAEPYNENETLHVDFWVTQAELGNAIRSRTLLSVKGSVEISASSTRLLTETSGGKDKLQAKDRLNAYKYAMSSHERLVTMEDIRNFCKYELSGKLKEVRFEKGLSLSDHPKEGYIRTLDIKLYPFHYTEFEPYQWQYLSSRLLTRIKAKSIGGIYYRIMVEAV